MPAAKYARGRFFGRHELFRETPYEVDVAPRGQ
jgi:hypothetical protein